MFLTLVGLLLLTIGTHCEPLLSKHPSPSEQQVIFKQIGNYATHIEYHHIYIPINLQKYSETPARALDIIEDYSQKQDKKDEATSAALNITKSKIENLRNELHDVIQAIPLEDEKSRKNIETFFAEDCYNGLHRCIDIGGLLSVSKSKSVITHIADIEPDYLNHLDLYSNEYVENLQQMVKFNRLILSFASNNIFYETEEISNNIMSTINQAKSHRLSEDLLSRTTVQKMYNHLDEMHNSRFMDMMLDSPRDLYQAEVSYLYMPEENQLRLFLHVPMIMQEKSLNLYQFFPVPLSQTLTPNMSIIPSLKENFIAVGPEFQFKILSQLDLNGCKVYKRSTTYVCRGHSVVGTDMESSCLGAYFLGKVPEIISKCRFELSPIQELVFRIGSNDWIISSPSTFSTVVKCPDSFQTIQIKPFSVVNVPYGCTLNLKTHIIQASGFSFSKEIEQNINHFELELDAARLFPGLSLPQISAVLSQFEHFNGASIDYVNNAANQMKQAQNEATLMLECLEETRNDSGYWSNLMFYCAIAMIVGQILLFVWYCWNHCHTCLRTGDNKTQIVDV